MAPPPPPIRHAVLAAAGALAALALAAGSARAGTDAPAAPPAPSATAPAAPVPPAAAAQILCSDNPGAVALGSAQWNGWGRGVENTRYQPEPAIRASDVPHLALKWAFGYPGTGAIAGQPTIVDGRVFTAGAAGQVYSLDARTGCTYWRYDADGRGFGAIAIAELGTERTLYKPTRKRGRERHGHVNAHLEVLKPPSAAFFGDDTGSVYALDGEHGTLLWKTALEAQPGARIEGAPVPYQNRLYVAVGSSEPAAARSAGYSCCTFRGSVAALDLYTGRVLWKTYLVSGEPRPVASADGLQHFGPAGIAVAGTPTLDVAQGLLYVATGDSFNPALQPLADAVVALDMTDGRVRWSKTLQPAAEAAPAAESTPHEAARDAAAGGAAPGGQMAHERESRAFLSSPLLRTVAGGRRILLAGQSSGTVYGLDPERSGEILWQVRAHEPKAPGGIEFGMAADHHSVYAALTGLAADPANASGSLVAIDMRTGAKRWQSAAPEVACSWSGASGCSHGESQAVTVIPGAAFSGSMDGHLRAYSTIDGKILWDYDTAREFATVNRIAASGGSLDRGGPTIVNGVVYVNAGSERGRPGNVLLAFSVNGR